MRPDDPNMSAPLCQDKLAERALNMVYHRCIDGRMHFFATTRVKRDRETFASPLLEAIAPRMRVTE